MPACQCVYPEPDFQVWKWTVVINYVPHALQLQDSQNKYMKKKSAHVSLDLKTYVLCIYGLFSHKTVNVCAKIVKNSHHIPPES